MRLPARPNFGPHPRQSVRVLNARARLLVEDTAKASLLVADHPSLTIQIELGNYAIKPPRDRKEVDALTGKSLLNGK